MQPWSRAVVGADVVGGAVVGATVVVSPDGGSGDVTADANRTSVSATDTDVITNVAPSASKVICRRLCARRRSSRSTSGRGSDVFMTPTDSAERVLPPTVPLRGGSQTCRAPHISGRTMRRSCRLGRSLGRMSTGGSCARSYFSPAVRGVRAAARNHADSSRLPRDLIQVRIRRYSGSRKRCRRSSRGPATSTSDDIGDVCLPFRLAAGTQGDENDLTSSNRTCPEGD